MVRTARVGESRFLRFASQDVSGCFEFHPTENHKAQPMNKSRYFLTACFLVLSGVAQVGASDWYNWRGPWQTGASPEKDLPASWSPDPTAADNNLVWKAPYGCRSTPLVMNGRVYLINYTGQNKKSAKGEILPDLEPDTIQERVMCLDADTG